MLTPNRFRILIKKMNIFRNRRRKWMMSGHIATFLFLVNQKRKLNNPKKIELAAIDRQASFFLQKSRCLKTDPAENRTRNTPFGRRKEDDVALLHLQCLFQSGLLLFRKEFYNRGLPFTVFNLDKSQSFGAKTEGNLRQMIQFPLRQISQSFRIEGFQTSSRFDRRLENFKCSFFKNRSDIDQFHSEPRIRLINPKTIHRLMIRHPRKRKRQFDSDRLFPDLRDQSLHRRIYFLAID